MSTLPYVPTANVAPRVPRVPSHPLDPLGPHEIEDAAAILRAAGEFAGLSARTRIMAVTLREPDRAAIRAYRPGDAWDRTAFVVVLDNADGKTYEANVSLTERTVTSWAHVPDVQPAVVLDEFYESERACKADPRWQAALRRHGVTDFDLCMVDPWSAGNYGLPDEVAGRRLVRALTWVRTSPDDNGYARPVENLVTVIDLNAMEVVRVEDGEVVPLPPTDANYTAEAVGEARPDLQPIEIHQPHGVSFAVDGYKVSWQKWQFRLGFNAREGLVLYTVSYRDGERERSILDRAAVVDMVVPYGDPRPHYNRRNAFDVGEYGIGTFVNSLALGCDCLGEIYYFDACLNDTAGNAIPIPNAICMHEEDASILWKHTDLRTGSVEVRRSRRLVVSFITTVGNYDYAFYWYFYQDGSLELDVKMTGVISNGATLPGAPAPQWGTIVAPGVYGPIHQHFFNARLDMAIDGPTNAVYEHDTVADPPGPDNPLHNAFHEEATLLDRESAAQRTIDPLRARYWKIVNRGAANAHGTPTGYRLQPGENVLPFASAEAPVIKRAGFMTKHLWVTRYDPDERYATGDYPNQHPGGEGLPRFAARDRPLADEELVVWYTFGAHHVVRPEDWPVMPVSSLGFTLKPSGFFDRNPALDVPRPGRHVAIGAGTSGTGSNGTAGNGTATNGASCH